jgi:hypothetical protein
LRRETCLGRFVTAEDTVSLRQDRDMLVERIHGRAGVDAPPTSGEHVSCGTLKPPLVPAHPRRGDGHESAWEDASAAAKQF